MTLSPPHIGRLAGRVVFFVLAGVLCAISLWSVTSQLFVAEGAMQRHPVAAKTHCLRQLRELQERWDKAVRPATFWGRRAPARPTARSLAEWDTTYRHVAPQCPHHRSDLRRLWRLRSAWLRALEAQSKARYGGATARAPDRPRATPTPPHQEQ
ncbi:MAG: hypothetical protein ACPGUV_00900 [Polyangiales bacterium]